MIPGITALGEVEIGGLPDGLSLAVPSPFTELTDADDVVHLFEAEPWRRDQVVTMTTPPAPIAMVELMGADLVTVGRPVTVRAADKRYRTGAADTPAHTNYRARILRGFSVALGLEGGGEIAPLGGARASRGEISIGGWDSMPLDWARLSFEGRKVQLLVGRRDGARVGFTDLFAGAVEAAEWDRGVYELRLADPATRLQTDFAIPKYAGTGGAEGGADLEGQQRPWALGLCRSVELQPVDKPREIYELSWRGIQGALAIYDSWLGFTNSGVVVDSYDALDALTVAGEASPPDLPAGHYALAISSAGSYVRLGSSPLGTVTADLEGDNEGGYVSSLPDIIRRLAGLAGVGSLNDPSEIDAPAFARANLTETGTAHLWLGVGDDREVWATMADLAERGGCYLRFTRGGKLSIRALKLPDERRRAFTRGDYAGEARALHFAAPIRELRCGYRQVHRVATRDELAGAVSDEAAELFTREWRYPTPAASSSAEAIHRAARSVTINTPFDEQAASERVQARLIAFLKLNLKLFEVELQRGRFDLWIGEDFTLEDAEIGLDTAADVLCVGLDLGPIERAVTAVFLGEVP